MFKWPWALTVKSWYSIQETGEDGMADSVLEAYSTGRPDLSPLHSLSPASEPTAPVGTVTLLNRLSPTAVNTVPPAKSQPELRHSISVALEQESFSIALISFTLSLKKEKKK